MEFTSTATLRAYLGTLNEEARKGWDCSARLAIVVAKELHRRAAEQMEWAAL